jgi:hypothetical protein
VKNDKIKAATAAAAGKQAKSAAHSAQVQHIATLEDAMQREDKQNWRHAARTDLCPMPGTRKPRAMTLPSNAIGTRPSDEHRSPSEAFEPAASEAVETVGQVFVHKYMN